MTYREGGNIDYRQPQPLHLDDEATWAEVIAKVEPTYPSLERREWCSTRLEATP